MKTSDLDPILVKRIASAVNGRFASQMEIPIDSAVVVNAARPEMAKRKVFSFVLGACQYPAGLLDVDLAYASYERLANKLVGNGVVPDALILTGDQIYADATAGLFDPAQLDDNYRRAYERLLQKSPVRDVMRRIPVVTMLDDHEIMDNFEPINSIDFPEKARQKSDKYARAIRHSIKYQRGVGPYPDNIFTDITDQQLWYSLEKSGLPVFVTNTRTERGHRTAKNIDQVRIMSDPQIDALKKWLLLPELQSLPKVVVSPSIFLPRHSYVQSTGSFPQNSSATHALLSDAWDGYPASMNDLLAFIVENNVRNVVFVSGDEHLGCSCRALIRSESGNMSTVIHSIHTSALYAPYPFANAHPADLLCNENFTFEAPGPGNSKLHNYHCKIEAYVHPGFGFTLINFRKDARGEWSINCEYDRDSDTGVESFTSRLD